MFEVLKTAGEVAEESLFVRIDREAVTRLCRRLIREGIGVPPWDDLYHFSGDGEKMVAYFLVLDSLNFCFWPERGQAKWEFEYGSERLSGYYALAASLKAAVESEVPITRAEYLASLSLEELRQVLSGQGELQLLGERLKVLRELGQVLVRDFGGEAHRLVEEAEGSAAKLTGLLHKNLSSFRDTATYRGREVYFLKRAQIFVADLQGAFRGRMWGQFHDVEILTAFADYKVPQVLRHVGVLSYGRDLGERVDRQIYLEPGGAEEVEIRANTIRAVELIRRELGSMGMGLKAFEVDWILWNMGQREEFREKPYHRTVTIFY